MTQKITPFLWFEQPLAEEAAQFYVDTFRDAEILNVQRYGEGAPMPAGTAMVVNFRVHDMTFNALNGGPHWTMNGATSFFVSCADQAEVDRYWDALAPDAQFTNCGWITDKYGVTWQIIPTRLIELMGDPDPARAGRVMTAMMEMGKIDIAALETAAVATE